MILRAILAASASLAVLARRTELPLAHAASARVDRLERSPDPDGNDGAQERSTDFRRVPDAQPQLRDEAHERADMRETRKEGARDGVAREQGSQDRQASAPARHPPFLRRCWINGRYWCDASVTHLVRRRHVLPLSGNEKEAYLAIRHQGLFDGAWYLEANPDVATSGVDPLHHLVRHGIYEGRSPNRQIVTREAMGIGPDPNGMWEDIRQQYLSVVSSLYGPVGNSGGNPAELGQTVDKGHLHRLSDGSVHTGLARFERFPLFRSKDYLALNAPLKDAPGLIAHRHAFTYGFSEGRSIFDRHTIANELGLRSRMPPEDLATKDPATKDLATRDLATRNLDQRGTRKLAVSIVYNASGNSFLHEIAQCLLFDLSSDGHDVVLLDDTDDPSRICDHNIVVAPHEFFFIGRGASWIRDDILRRSVMFNTEQPQTVWFDRAVPFNLVSAGLIDISSQVAAIYGACMPTIHCDLSGPPLEDTLPHSMDPIFSVLPKAAKRAGRSESTFEDRSVDVSFFGGMSPHRDRFFARTARFFSDYKTLFYCRRDESPLVKNGTTDLLSTARHVAFHSKIVLNVHRDEFGFFEWHRIVRLGIEAGALVVSEPCLPHPYLKPNVHYFEESGRHIQNLVEWLLKTPDGRAEARAVTRRAFSLVDQRRRRRESGRRIARFLDGPEGAS